MLSYALGRPITFRDEQTVLSLQSKFEESGYKMRSLDQSDCHVRRVFRHGFTIERFKNDRCAKKSAEYAGTDNDG